MIGCSSKKKGQRKAAALKVWGSITSRGEQPTRGLGGGVRTSTPSYMGPRNTARKATSPSFGTDFLLLLSVWILFSVRKPL